MFKNILAYQAYLQIIYNIHVINVLCFYNYFTATLPSVREGFVRWTKHLARIRQEELGNGVSGVIRSRVTRSNVSKRARSGDNDTEEVSRDERLSSENSLHPQTSFPSLSTLSKMRDLRMYRNVPYRLFSS